MAKRLYEGMFLVDSALATADWEGTLAVVENILKRADAEIVAIRKWGERKLAYDIGRQTRGTYILAYFNADGRRIAGIEKDVQLSEKIVRVLILGTEKRPPEMIEADIKGLPRVEPPEGMPERDDAEPRRERRYMGRDQDFEPAGRRETRAVDETGQ
jgi:small subunit ribosomal protein S6